MSIQPSEFIKVLYIITFSKHLSLVKGQINHPLSLLKLGAHAGAIIGLILVQGDLGSALVYIFLTAVMLYCAGLSLWYFLGAAALLAAVSPVLWNLLKTYQKRADHCRFLAGERSDRQGISGSDEQECDCGRRFFSAPVFRAAQNIKKCRMCIPILYLRSPVKNLVFLVPCLSLLCFCVLVVRILMLARKMQGSYASYMCAGAAAVIIAQSTENIGMCLAKLPVVGITLPFMSYGGSSMVASWCLIGLVQSISAHRGKYFFERQTSDA